MKKLLQILFISAYLISNIGISIATHFCCCGTESEIAVLYTVTAGEGEDCFEDNCEEQACLTEVVSLKIKDLHISVPKDDTDHYAEITAYYSPETALTTTTLFSPTDNSGFYFSDLPVYLSNCNFRN